MKTRTLQAGALLYLLVSSLPFALAQDSKPSDDPVLDAQIASIRADTRADKMTIIKGGMKFTPQESAVFWPIYQKYDAELTQINDERVELIKSYAQKYTTLTDADAKQMADKSFDLEERRVQLSKKYFGEFNKQLPATTVARFFQLEHRLNLIIDAKIASELPPVMKPVSPDSPATAQ